MHTACAALLPEYWWLHLSHGPSGSHMGRYSSDLIISILSLPTRIYSIFYWMGRNGPPLPDVFHADAVCIPVFLQIFHSCYPAHFSRNTCTDPSLSYSYLLLPPHYTGLRFSGSVYGENPFYGSRFLSAENRKNRLPNPMVRRGRKALFWAKNRMSS